MRRLRVTRLRARAPWDYGISGNAFESSFSIRLGCRQWLVWLRPPQ
jgi:hypothetical protein